MSQDNKTFFPIPKLQKNIEKLKTKSQRHNLQKKTIRVQFFFLFLHVLFIAKYLPENAHFFTIQVTQLPFLAPFMWSRK